MHWLGVLFVAERNFALPDTVANHSSQAKSGRFRTAALALGIFAAAAFALTGWRYVTPLSGVTGAPGALLAMLGEAALVFAAVVLLTSKSNGIRRLFIGLSWLGAVLTLIALVFLHGWLSAVMIALALIAIAIATFSKPTEGRP